MIDSDIRQFVFPRYSWQYSRVMDDLQQKRFLKGLVFVWAPLIPLVPACLNSFQGITEQKATGLGAVAGGLAEVYISLGLGLTFLFEVTAIVLLLRTFSRTHWVRNLASVLSICVSLIAILLLGLFVWVTVFVNVHRASRAA